MSKEEITATKDSAAIATPTVAAIHRKLEGSSIFDRIKSRNRIMGLGVPTALLVVGVVAVGLFLLRKRFV